MRALSRTLTATVSTVVVTLSVLTSASVLAVSPGLGSGVVERSGVAPSSAGQLTSGPSVSNGLVQLAFPNDTPSFSVTAVQDARVRSGHDLTGIAEINPAGNTTAFAAFQAANASWNFTTRSSPAGLIVRASATLAVVPSTGLWDSGEEVPDDTGDFGNATVDLGWYLNASTGVAPDSVRFTVNVTGWPWIDPANDSLGLAMTMLAAGETTITAGTSNMLQEVANGTANRVATLTWSPSARVLYSNGSSDSSSVGSFHAFAPGGLNSTVRLLFSAVRGGYHSLSYDPVVLLELSAFRSTEPPVWLVTDDSWAVLGGVGAASALLAAVAVLRRRQDSEEP